MPIIIEIHSKLGKYIQKVDFESVSLAYFHYKKAGHVAKLCTTFIAKEKEIKSQKKERKKKDKLGDIKERKGLENKVLDEDLEECRELDK